MWSRKSPRQRWAGSPQSNVQTEGSTTTTSHRHAGSDLSSVSNHQSCAHLETVLWALLSLGRRLETPLPDIYTPIEAGPLSRDGSLVVRAERGDICGICEARRGSVS